MDNDTIVAAATPPGESAVAVVRLSGPRALAIAARSFRGKRSPNDAPSHRILFGTFLDVAGRPLDQVLLSVFRAPRSYTGEDVVEISSHGGLAIPRAILESLIEAGARPARPGEFTERAFRNGKMDLAQAEAVAGMVRARSDRAARAALASMGGDLSRRVEAADRELVDLLAEVESRIDFPAEVGEPVDGEALADRCARVRAGISGWLEGMPDARRREGGLRVALIGRPNVGKSSLLNALVGYDRAITSEVPGTTRDTVEASIWMDGIEIQLTDTAGLRDGEEAGAVERLGMGRAARALNDADLAILVVDQSDPDGGGAASLHAIPDGGGERRPFLVAWNKADLAKGTRAPGARGSRGAGDTNGSAAAGSREARILAEVETVAIRPGGADTLRAALRAAIPAALAAHAGEEIPMTSARQEAHLAEARDALAGAERSLRGDFSYDLVAVDLTEARRALAEVLGRGVDQQVIARIFARFCIGK